MIDLFSKFEAKASGVVSIAPLIGAALIGGGFGAQLSGTSLGGGQSGPNWDAYLAQDPGLMQEFNRVNSEGRYLQGMGITTPQQFAEWHYNTKGASEGRQVPQYEQPAQQQAPQAQDPALSQTAAPVNTSFGQQLDGGTQYGQYTPQTLRPVVPDRPALTPAPVYVPPALRESSVSQAAFEASPDYAIAQAAIDQDSNRAIANRAALGSLDSGAAQKELQRIGLTDTLSVGYNPFRQFTAGRDDAANASNLNNAQFGANLANSQWGTTNSFNQQGYNSDRAFGQDLFNIDRTNYQSQQNQRLSNLFAVAGLGQGANSSNIAAGSNYANSAGQGLLSTAAAQGNAGLAGAGLIGGAIQNAGQGFGNALANYYGGQTGQNSLYSQNGLAGLY